ncbi:glycosyltransferase family 4 protein [Polynucleobacter paneuropaeus]|nr:glycosyltransferase family 4 protein [Polynucleobacter paneuropaeus]QWD09519.1 glycosyltransferase family 4 protein [Polynucleobacter paneuropaeus]
MFSKKNKIGVDVSCISPPITGIGKYLIEVLQAMEHAELDYYLYSHQKLNLSQYGLNNYILRQSNCFIFRLRGGRLIWSILVLPFLVRKDNLNLFWAPAHKIPLGLGSNLLKVVTVHDLVWRHASKTMKLSNYLLDMLCMSFSVKVADKIIAVSKSTKLDLLQEFNLNEDSVEVIELGVRLPKSTHFWKDKSNSPYILFVGTIEPRKNLINLINAYALMPIKLRQEVKLQIVGMKGWGVSDLNQIIDDLNLSKHINFLGYVEDNELDDLYRGALCLAIPSFYEGFGLPILEAMARGVPILTSNVSSMPEVCGRNAVFVDPRSVASIRDGLTLLLENEVLRNELVREGLVWSAQFTWKNTAKRTAGLFKNLLNLKKDSL